MDHLSKQQLVLLALLVSFMTSLATGIVTVSLMDQAPQGVTKTITQVIEKTIQQAVPQNAAVGTVTLKVEDQLAVAVAKVSSSIVKIKDTNSNAIVGRGIIVSKEGIIAVDRSVVNLFSGYSASGYSAVLSDGTIVPVNIAQPQPNGDIIFLTPSSSAMPSSAKVVFTPIDAVSSVGLGQTVFSLSGTSTDQLGQGTITAIAPSPSPVSTSIAASKVSVGSPLFDVSGSVIGIRTSSLSSLMPVDGGASFYPIATLMGAIPALK